MYTGLGGYYLPGQPEFEVLDSAARSGNSSFRRRWKHSRARRRGLFPLFISGYTGRITRRSRAWQRNHVSTYPSAVQIQTGLGIGLEPGATDQQDAVDASWVWAMRPSANMVAAGMGVDCTDLVLADKRIALAPHDETLPGSGLEIKAGTLAGAKWEFHAFSGPQRFLTITNEQTAILGLGPGWRTDHDEPPWRVEIDGDPPIVATWGRRRGRGAANSRLNAAQGVERRPPLAVGYGWVCFGSRFSGSGGRRWSDAAGLGRLSPPHFRRSSLLPQEASRRDFDADVMERSDRTEVHQRAAARTPGDLREEPSCPHRRR